MGTEGNAGDRASEQNQYAQRNHPPRKGSHHAGTECFQGLASLRQGTWHGYSHMLPRRVEQAKRGCDFDFLSTGFGDSAGEPEIN